MATFPPLVDRSTGYVVPAAEWNGLLGATGGLAYVRDGLDRLLVNASGGALAVGAVCVQDTANPANALTTTTAADTRRVWIATAALGPAVAGMFRGVGLVDVLVTGAVAVGDQLCTATVAQQARTATASEPSFGVCVAAPVGGRCLVRLHSGAPGGGGGGGVGPGSIGTTELADGGVTSAKIADGTIVAGDLADGAVTSAKILDGTIATGDLADGAITSAKIADGTIVAGDLADGAVTTGKILDGTILAADLAAGSLIFSKFDRSTFPRCRVYHNASLSIPSGTWTVIPFNSERIDVGSWHTIASTPLTGTVSKTSGTATLTGSGTAFTSQLKVGDWITVPGVAPETKVVTAIADATNLTVAGNWSNTASGQTATRDDSGRLTVPAPADYFAFSMALFQSNATGDRGIRWMINNTITAALTFVTATTGANGTGMQAGFPGPLPLNAGDYLELAMYQNSGTSLLVFGIAQYTPEAGVWLAG